MNAGAEFACSEALPSVPRARGGLIDSSPDVGRTNARALYVSAVMLNDKTAS